MRNNFIVWLLLGSMLVSSLFMAVGSDFSVSAAGGPNLTLGKVITASGHNQTYEPGNVQDNNQGTYWESANHAFPQWIQVDLAENTSIDQIVLKLPPNWEERTQTLAVQGSADGMAFTDIVGSASYDFDPNSNNSVTISFAAADTRYVRLNITGNTGWPAGQLSEFEIYGAVGTTPTPTPTLGTNIAIGKPIAASSSTFTYVAANANDNDTNTYWEGGGNPSTLTLDLGANHNITSIVLKLNPDPIWSTRTQTIQVLGHSQDTASFSNLVSAQAYTFNPSTGNSVTIPLTATVKRLQLNISSNTGAPAGQIAEFQVFGTPASNPDLTITDLTWSPSSPNESSTITLNAAVKTSAMPVLPLRW